MKKILLSGKMPTSVYDALSDYELVRHDSDVALEKEAFKTMIADVDALLCPLSDKIDAEIIDSAKNLKIIANFGAGYDNIDIAYAKSKGIIVTNAPAKSSTTSTAELALTLILALMRRVVEGDHTTRRGDFHGWKPTFHLGRELAGKTLGIIGIGRIGQDVARKALNFDCHIIYWNRTRLDETTEKKLHATYVELPTLIKTSDVITLHLAYNPELHHLVNEAFLDEMKTDAVLINAARGPLVDEKALAQALKEKKIHGCALDVYEYEPAVTEALFALDNCILAPHLGNATVEARDEMGAIAVENILAVFTDKEAPNRVNP